MPFLSYVKGLGPLIQIIFLFYVSVIYKISFCLEVDIAYSQSITRLYKTIGRGVGMHIKEQSLPQ